MEAIQTINLTKRYGNARGITNLNLTVEKGDFFGFIGPNGAGKSTTIRTLLGLIHPTGGTAEVLGMDINKKKEQILARVGYLPSEAIFYRGMKVRDILKFSANLRKKDCSEEERHLCERFQLDTSRKVDELSFGNRKKVAIVCALMHKPELLILDEPTSGLDPIMQKEFFCVLKERNQEGTTVFLSSHILSEVQHNCKRAAIIREGELVTCDSVEALSRTNAKRVTVRGDFNPEHLPGMRDMQFVHDGISFLYTGDMNEFIRCLSAGQITDLSVAEPDLEEIFMHYYTDGGSVK